MKLEYIPSKKEILDSAFGRATKHARPNRKLKDRLRRKKELEGQKVKIAGKLLSTRLHDVVVSVPSLDKLEPFYLEMIETQASVDEIKKALAHIEKISKLVNRVQRAEMKQLYNSKSVKDVGKIKNRFFARSASLMKDAGKSLDLLRDFRRKALDIPDINFKVPTAILAGYPNTGKTTILKRLTGSKPRIAAYPFTTKGIKIGYYRHRYLKIQVIDTPGLLDREVGKRNKIEARAVAALKHLADLIVFVVDPTDNCGFPLKKQLALYKEIKRKFKDVEVIGIVNKCDVASKEEIAGAEKGFEGKVFREGEGVESRLAEEIAVGTGKKRGRRPAEILKNSELI